MALFEEILKMSQAGMSDSDIVRRLAAAGFSPLQISEAINQAKVKQSASTVPEGLSPSIMEEEVPGPAVPSPTAPVPYQPMPSPRMQMPQQQMQMPQRAEEYQPYPYQYPTYETAQPKMDTEAIEEIAEEIINEKWQEIKTKLGDIVEWKSFTEKRITSMDERMKRIESSFDRLQIALLGKVQEYGQNIRDLGAEMQSTRDAFSKIVSPLVDNVKELGKITEDMKKARK